MLGASVNESGRGAFNSTFAHAQGLNWGFVGHVSNFPWSKVAVAATNYSLTLIHADVD